MRVQPAPIVGGEIDHDKPCGREPLSQLLPGINIAGADQQHGGPVQTRIVRNQEKSVHIGGRAPDHIEDGIGDAS